MVGDVFGLGIGTRQLRKQSKILLGEYFLSKNEKQKSKEFFEKILTLENSNPEIRLEVEKKIRRDLSE